MQVDRSHLEFQRDAFPCQFLIEVQEGFARLEIENRGALAKLFAYCRENDYAVHWTRAVLDEASSRELADRFPGGKYVASRKVLDPQAHDHD